MYIIKTNKLKKLPICNIVSDFNSSDTIFLFPRINIYEKKRHPYNKKENGCWYVSPEGNDAVIIFDAPEIQEHKNRYKEMFNIIMQENHLHLDPFTINNKSNCLMFRYIPLRIQRLHEVYSY